MLFNAPNCVSLFNIIKFVSISVSSLGDGKPSKNNFNIAWLKGLGLLYPTVGVF